MIISAKLLSGNILEFKEKYFQCLLKMIRRVMCEGTKKEDRFKEPKINTMKLCLLSLV